MEIKMMGKSLRGLQVLQSVGLLVNLVLNAHAIFLSLRGPVGYQQIHPLSLQHSPLYVKTFS